jgi:hypothetical protein
MEEESLNGENLFLIVIIRSNTTINIPRDLNIDIIEMTELIINQLENINNLDFINLMSNESINTNLMSIEDFKNLKKIDIKNNCPICFKDTTNNIILDCNHVFCNNCIKEWLVKNKNNCPICRK